MKIQELLYHKTEEQIDEALAIHDNQYNRVIGGVNANRFVYDFDDRDYDTGFNNETTFRAIREQNPNLNKEELIALIKHLDAVAGQVGRSKTTQMVGGTTFDVSTTSVQH